jgi:S-adenosylmethionine:tRNA ribosyltransferase-isomerase
VRTDLLDYVLPEELIADAPPLTRDAGRMCVVLEAGLRHGRVRDFPRELGVHDLVVLNQTKVRAARLHCHRWAPTSAQTSGGKVELLFLERLPWAEEGVECWTALGRANRPLKPGDTLESGSTKLRIFARREGGLIEILVPADLEALLAEHGQLPIPPYMRRNADERDDLRYQTVFAQELGSAAAPTAGLHLTEEMLGELTVQGTRVGRLTLHVGIGTFRPVVTDDLDQHAMHAESFEVPPQLAAAVAETRRLGGRVVAVGTTVVRALEAAADPDVSGLVRPMAGRTDILIQPGYSFRVVDALLTNFHMPRSTLLALVSAFVGRRRVLSAYRAAIEARYRFLSYGDAMWIPRRQSESQS